MRILLLGAGAREHAIGETLVRGGAHLFVVASNDNPGLQDLARQSSGAFQKHNETDSRYVAEWAVGQGIDMAVIGLEDPLAHRVPDALKERGIPTVGPTMQPARIETSKRFARELLQRHNIGGQVEWQYFEDEAELAKFLRSAGGQYALKPVGLTAGKGVMVMGEHLNSVDEAISYGTKVIRESIGGTAGVLLEERLDGEEFTLQAFVDGNTVVPMPLVRDYKRAYEGDVGPNTGSMGSYSQPNGLLRFIDEDVRDKALGVMQAAVEALRAERAPYQGILYGQFMLTAAGLKVIEFNARFGDPEALNVLPLLDTNFVDVCQAIVAGTLADMAIRFRRQGTVCKYITPPGYPEAPQRVPIAFDRASIEALGVRLYFAKVEQNSGQMYTTTSRFAALVGIADTVEEAEASVEQALAHVHGRFHVRGDIGKAALLNKAPGFVQLTSRR